MAQNVISSMHDAENISEIEKLLQAGIIIEEKKESEGIFSGKTVVLTGSLVSYKRSKASELITANGGKISDTVTKNVNLVIMGADPGSKIVKAEKLGIEIWDEEKFLSEINKI